jgi:hypothetical protein
MYGLGEVRWLQFLPTLTRNSLPCDS